MKIEKIFALKQEQEKQQVTQPQTQTETQLPPKEAYERYLMQKRQQQGISLAQAAGKNLAKDINSLIDGLMKPEQPVEQQVPALLMKKKKDKKRQQGMHL